MAPSRKDSPLPASSGSRPFWALNVPAFQEPWTSGQELKTQRWHSMRICLLLPRAASLLLPTRGTPGPFPGEALMPGFTYSLSLTSQMKSSADLRRVGGTLENVP